MKTTEMSRRRMQSYFDYSTLLLIAINSSIMIPRGKMHSIALNFKFDEENCGLLLS